MTFLPREIEKVMVPPIKCQGIKTKLIPFIAQNIHWDAKGKWIEPFLGSGVVAFNIQPKKAILCDTNKHIIQFYKEIKSGIITEKKVRGSLEVMGAKLKKGGVDYYYEVRDRFNLEGNSIDFLFLNRSCFNGLMRFNSKGGFNVPFGHKPDRFAKAYITKIANQVRNLSEIMKGKDWKFYVMDYRKSISLATKGDFVYMDPPYVGRHTDYFNSWSDKDAVNLSELAASLPCQYALSMWLENRYRKNDHIEQHWGNTHIKTASHFYHVGSTESLRNAMTEALVLNVHANKVA